MAFAGRVTHQYGSVAHIVKIIGYVIRFGSVLSNALSEKLRTHEVFVTCHYTYLILKFITLTVAERRVQISSDHGIFFGSPWKTKDS